MVAPFLLSFFKYLKIYGSVLITYQAEKEKAEGNFEKDAVAGYYNKFHENEKTKAKKPNQSLIIFKLGKRK